MEVCIRVRMDSDSHWYVRANSVNDPGSSDDRGHHGRAARGWDLCDTRRVVPQQGGGATRAPESRPALRRYCPREPANPEGEMSAAAACSFAVATPCTTLRSGAFSCQRARTDTCPGGSSRGNPAAWGVVDAHHPGYPAMTDGRHTPASGGIHRLLGGDGHGQRARWVVEAQAVPA